MTSCTGRGIPGILLMRVIRFASSDSPTEVLLRPSTNRSAWASFFASCPTKRLTLLVVGENTSKGMPPAPVPGAPPTRKSDVRTLRTPASPAAVRKCTCNPSARKALAAWSSAAVAVSPSLAARAFLRISERPETKPLFPRVLLIPNTSPIHGQPGAPAESSSLPGLGNTSATTAVFVDGKLHGDEITR